MKNDSIRKQQPDNPLEWELDSHHSRLLFNAAKKQLEERISNYRQQVMELERFDSLPEVYNKHNDSFGLFDRKTKQDRIANLLQWIASAERVHRFCIKVGEAMMQWEAEKFGAEINEFFKGRQ